MLLVLLIARKVFHGGIINAVIVKIVVNLISSVRIKLHFQITILTTSKQLSIAQYLKVFIYEYDA